MKLDAETASLLGWDKIRQALADRARTPLGRKACLELTPSRDEQVIARAQARHRQLAWLSDQGKGLPVEAIEDLQDDLVRAAKGGVLDGEAVGRVALAMIVSTQVRTFLMTEGDQAGEALVDLARGSHDLAAVGRDLAGAFEPDGRLRASASEALFGLRRAADRLAEAIRARLERMIRGGRVAAALSEPYVTLRADRYVLPVRSDSRGEVAGIVHDTSQTGATLFIEPSAIIDDGNRLKIAQAKVVEEERRILAEYSREIAAATGQLKDNLAMLAKADLQRAVLELGQAFDGLLPELGGAGFALAAARHPLMALSDEPVVANDIELPSGRQALLVTGPNAGGKTVVLKTLGLCCLMAQAGLPLPAAEGSRLAIFGHLGAVIGDAQDIAQGLSTFSAHIERIGRILTRADATSLVLLDELAADTDPRHGAALAVAILQELADTGATALATTHYEELKQLPFEDERFANASVGFDLERMQPTFSLHPEVPGRSLTLDIARRLGLSDKLLARAAERLAGAEHQLDEMLERLEQERQALSAVRGELSAARAKAEREVLEHRQASEELDQRRKQLLGEGREAVLAEIADVRQEVARVIEQIRTGAADMRTAVDGSHKLIALEEQVARDLQALDGAAPPASAPAEPPALHPGDRVRVLSLDKIGPISSIDRAGAMVTVQLGSVRTRVPRELIELVERGREPNPPKRPRREGGTTPRTSDTPQPRTQVRSSLNTLDLRGQRADEAADAVDKFLDDLFGAGEPAAFIIHGHGTGALRAAVRDYLASSPYPRAFRAGTPEEGGDGVTVVSLR